VTVVAFCVAALTSGVIATSAVAVFGPLSGFSTAPRPQPLELARHQCETSLTHSIMKRTKLSQVEAETAAEFRCGLLFQPAPKPAPVRQNDI